MWPWLRLGRRRHAIPDALWTQALTAIPYAAALPAAKQQRLRELTIRFLRTKVFEAAAGLELTDAMRVHVGLQACLLILNLDPGYYDGWRGVVLSAIFSPGEHVDVRGGPRWTEGQPASPQHGPVILSWDASQSYDEHMNIVLHEFA
jgi:Mlc titration factor MtfA (ptsG expression regulator)